MVTCSVVLLQGVWSVTGPLKPASLQTLGIIWLQLLRIHQCHKIKAAIILYDL